MDLPYERILFFTKTLTGLVMLLNLGLVLSLRAHLQAVRSSDGRLSSNGRVILGLAALVILVNVTTVYCNSQMLQAARELSPARR
jgi:hypothetical protein